MAASQIGEIQYSGLSEGESADSNEEWLQTQIYILSGVFGSILLILLIVASVMAFSLQKLNKQLAAIDAKMKSKSPTAAASVPYASVLPNRPLNAYENGPNYDYEQSSRYDHVAQPHQPPKGPQYNPSGHNPQSNPANQARMARTNPAFVGDYDARSVTGMRERPNYGY